MAVQRDLTISLNTLLHSVTCNQSTCHGGCAKWKFTMVHAQTCPNRSDCSVCQPLMTLCEIHARKCNSDGCKVPFCKIIRGSAVSKNGSHQTQTKSSKAKLQLKKDVPNKIFLPVLNASPANDNPSKKGLGPSRMGYIETTLKKTRMSSIFDECRNYEKESNTMVCDWTAEDSNDPVPSTPTKTEKDIANAGIDNCHPAEQKPEPHQTKPNSNQLSHPVSIPATSPTPLALGDQGEPPSTSIPIECPKEEALDEGQTQKIKFGDNETEFMKISVPRHFFKLDSIALCASGVLLAPLFSYIVVKILKAAARTS